MDNADGPVTEPAISPEAVEATDFPKSLRGFEVGAVTERVELAATEIRRLHTVVESLQAKIAELEEAAAADPDPSELVALVGDEAARILDAAQDAANDKIKRAEARSEDITAAAHADAADIVEEGRASGKQMVLEAQKVRERILSDLAEKRHQNRIEVEQLRVVRERFLEALRLCRDGLDNWLDEIIRVESQAVAAAQQTGLRVGAEPRQTVGELESEIQTGQLVGMPLDGKPADADADSPDADTSDGVADTPDAGDSHHSADMSDADTSDGAADSPDAADTPDSADAPDTADIADTPQAVDQDDAEPETAPPAGVDAGPVGDGEADTDSKTDSAVDTRSEYVHNVEYDDPPEPSADDQAMAAGGLYDVEAEAGPPAQFTPQAALQAIPAAAATSPGSGDDVDDVNAIFARLRSITSESVSDVTASPASSDPFTATSPPLPPGAAATPPATQSAGAPAGTSQPVSAHQSAVDSAVDELLRAARTAAVGGIARRLKRLVVDEQGEMLDGIRRNGSRAVRAMVAADTGHYARTVRTPLQDFASDIDVSIDDVDLRAAGEAVIASMVEPVRARLLALLDETDDSNELSAAVRAIYRESRSRRADSAAEAAFAAGWAEPVS